MTGMPVPIRPTTDSYEAAVAACRTEMSAYSLSQSRVAREIGVGVSTSTLGRWLRDVYEGGDMHAVTVRVEAWLETRRQARRLDFAAAGLDRHVDLGLSEEVEAVLAHAQAAGDITLVHGRSGAGKSWAAARYCATHSAAYRLQVTSAVVTVAGLLSRVAAAVGAGDRHPSALAAESAVVGRLEGRGALLVVDEAHHLSPRLLDELRGLRDAACGLALIGGDELWTGLCASSRCDQIIGRIGIRLPLGQPADADVLALAAGVLGRHPAQAEVKTLLAAARGAGGLHAVRRLLARAWVTARASGRERIATGDIAVAAEDAA